MAEVRVARLFDAVDPASGPRFAADRARIDGEDERVRVAEFLAAGRVVLHATGREPDRVEPARGAAVPMSVRTDGAWVWSDAVAYYARTHGIAPEPDFYAHIQGHGYRCPPTGEDAARRVLAVLYGAG